LAGRPEHFGIDSIWKDDNLYRSPQQHFDFFREVMGNTTDDCGAVERPHQSRKVAGREHQSVDVVASRTDRGSNTPRLGEDHGHVAGRIHVVPPRSRKPKLLMEPFQNVCGVLQ